MLKKFLVFASCLILIATTVGCGSENKTASTVNGSSSNVSVITSSANRPIDNCDHSYSDATCETPQKCEKCSHVLKEALGHNFVDNICSRKGCNTANIEWYQDKEINITRAEIQKIVSMEYKKPKNVIFMIGDGMGPNDIILTEKHYSSYCFDFGLALNQIEYTGFSTTYSSGHNITDSAAAATALATGVKINNDAIGISPTGENLTNLSEIARQNGKKVGIVTNDKVVGATPSAFTVHANSRSDYDVIARSFVSFAPDVLIGQDSSYFANLKLDRFIVSNEFSDFSNALNKNYNPDKSFIGFFSQDVFSTESLNTLAYCTEIALNRLKANSPDGFFLMIENTTCDNAGHSQNILGKMNGVVTLDRAVVSVLKFMKDNPDTLLIITSDHDNGGVKLPSDNSAVDNSLFTATGHTDINVRTFAVGYGAEYFNNKTLDNTDIAKFAINAVSN